MGCLDEDFHGLPWSRWYRPSKVHKGPKVQPGVPKEPGVYRVRIGNSLAYLGETGNLARRLVDDWGDLNTASSQPAKSRGDAFRHLVDLSTEMQGHYKVSWASGPGQWPYDLSDKAHRESLERCLGWIYRRRTGRTSFGNYARAGKGGQLVSDTARTGHPKEVLPAGLVHVGTRALVSEGRGPSSRQWMGLNWTEPRPRGELDVWEAPGLPGMKKAGQGPGLYKILRPGDEQLLFVGYGRHAAGSLNEAMGSIEHVEDKTIGSWCPLRRKVLKLECLELLGDLIGAHYHETASVATCQFAGVVKR
ncbi:hypothetical protein [Salinibacter ruber]|jgi:hypothetical protein|uniref:hypothetical protein n=1 Tax=Salinibacter ruber TaxID=146919 RepID=UPI00216A21A2|nr:hypothetical protein [Salinibacter ruber]MCS4038741.1 hypothetical protein [Salinibacter ruber]